MSSPVRMLGVLALALVVNLLLFCGLPLLTQTKQAPALPRYEEPFSLATLPKPERKVRNSRRKKFEQERKKPKVIKTALPKKSIPQKTKIQPLMPRLQLDAAPPMIAAQKIDPSFFESGQASLPGLKGFELGEVDTPPRLSHPVNPVYPYDARRAGITGVVRVRFMVDEHGRVSKITILSAKPKNVFEKSVLNAVRRWRFRPGVLDGKPVPTWVEVPLRFNLNS